MVSLNVNNTQEMRKIDTGVYNMKPLQRLVH